MRDRFVRFGEAGEAIEVPRPDAVKVVGARVAGLPIPCVPSDVFACVICGGAIWLARAEPALRAFIAAGAETLCTVCALGDGMTVGRMVTTEAALERVRTVVGSNRRPVQFGTTGRLREQPSCLKERRAR